MNSDEHIRRERAIQIAISSSKLMSLAGIQPNEAMNAFLYVACAIYSGENSGAKGISQFQETRDIVHSRLEDFFSKLPNVYTDLKIEKELHETGYYKGDEKWKK